jgi:hypothetical protein
MPAGRPKKIVISTPKRVDTRSEEYYLERALQTPGLLDAANYLKVLDRLMQIRGKPHGKPMSENDTEQPSDKLRGLLDKVTAR